MIEIQRLINYKQRIILALILFLALVFAVRWSTQAVFAQDITAAKGERIVTIHDAGQQKGIVTEAATVSEALEHAGVRLDSKDITEPSLDEPLVAQSYDINIYRARPVAIKDKGQTKLLVTAFRTAEQIAFQAGLKLNSADIATLSPSKNIVEDGAAEVLTVEWSTPVTFAFYGKTIQDYTRAKTVGEFLSEKDVSLSPDDSLTPGVDTPITSGMTIQLWRNGIQTVTVEEEIAFTVEQIKDANYPVGYRQVKEAGVNGVKAVTYEIDMKDGAEVSRKAVASVITRQAKQQIEVIGTKSTGGLTKAKGVNQFVDSNGVTHRETYYDLNMSSVMKNCNMGGYYTVRDDGVKVDRDGYVIIAANLGNYPRCSVTETSVGLAKVYDTGGFAAAHPYGFDIATDWSNYDGK